MRYGLPTLFRRVELALVQQTIEQTYKFTGSQRECSFMLMSSCFSIFLIMESFAFWTVINNTASSFYDVITQVTIAGFSHSFIFGFKLARVVIVPYDTTILGKCICILKTFN